MESEELLWKWVETGWASEDPKAPLYCVAFNSYHKTQGPIFATAGTNGAAVYKCPPKGGIELLQAYVDKDPKEDYYVCQWSVNVENGNPLLLLAGKKGHLVVIDTVDATRYATFVGHGSSINDIAVNPTRPWLVATASKDQAIRLWNLKSKVCVLIFQGDGGHQNEVLSVDWGTGGRDELLSAGMDSAIKVWSLDAFQDTITLSDTWTPTTISTNDNTTGGNNNATTAPNTNGNATTPNTTSTSSTAFPTRQVTFPAFSSRGVHWNYVDCVRWLGEFILSKSVDGRIICWKRTEPSVPAKPGVRPRRPREGQVTMVQILDLDTPPAGSDPQWWLRFSLDQHCTLLAIGTETGRVLIFNPHSQNKKPVTRLKPRRASGKNYDRGLLVRQTAASSDGGIIVSCHEDGSVTRYDRIGSTSSGGIGSMGNGISGSMRRNGSGSVVVSDSVKQQDDDGNGGGGSEGIISNDTERTLSDDDDDGLRNTDTAKAAAGADNKRDGGVKETNKSLRAATTTTGTERRQEEQQTQQQQEEQPKKPAAKLSPVMLEFAKESIAKGQRLPDEVRLAFEEWQLQNPNTTTTTDDVGGGDQQQPPQQKQRQVEEQDNNDSDDDSDEEDTDSGSYIPVGAPPSDDDEKLV